MKSRPTVLALIFRLPNCFSLLLLLVLIGCDRSTDAATPAGDLIEASSPRIVIAPDSLALSKVTDLDSLKEALLPLLLSDPTYREFDLWFERKTLWEEQVGGTENLTKYVQYIYEQLLSEEKLEDAATVANKKGRLLYASGLYPESIEAFRDALTTANEIGDSLLTGWAYMGMASGYFRLADSSQTYQYVQKAKEIASVAGHKGLQITTYLTAAGIEGSLGINDNVIPEMRALILQARENKFYELEKIGTLNLSYVYFLSGEFDSSIRLLLNTPSLNTGPITLNNTFLNYNLYEAYTGKGEHEKAYEYLQKGCTIADSLKYAYGINFCKLSRYEYFERTEDYQAAFTALKDYHEVYKKEAGVQARQKSERLKAELDYYEQQLQIERLSRAESEQKRAYQYWRNLLFAAILILILIFSLLYQRLRYNNRITVADQKRDVAETKLQVLQSQIQPHFIFNVITGIQNGILKSDPMTAYSYLGKFASLLRTLTTSATSVSILIDKEVKLIEDYLTLEKLRFREAFVYKVEVDPNLLNQGYRIPGMMIQPVVENAIIHGVSNLTYQGEITVAVNKQDDGVEVLVTDNGRGRAAALAIAKGTTNKHLSIASANREASLKYLRTIGYENAKITITDLQHQDGKAAGTRVLLFLPFYYENR